MNPLPFAFYDRDTVRVARELLGMRLVHQEESFIIHGRIAETEAYLGVVDPASHVANGFTGRTKGTWGFPGRLYVFSIHGADCMNAITLGEWPYGCVLIRGILKEGETVKGPGRVTKALRVSPDHNGMDLWHERSCVQIQRPEDRDHPPIASLSERVNVSKAADMRLRFYDTMIQGYAK